jgi:hypothetical protein
MRKVFFFLITVSVLFLSACKKSTEEFATAPLSDYYPLTIGKYVTYNLDSTVVYQNFGQTLTVNSYQVKLVVDAQITDNLGRPAYRIIRYIRNTSTDPWVPDNTFMAVNTGTSVEFIENNFRFLKMREPIFEGETWKGNTYIDTYSLNSNVKYLDDWDYTYDSLNVAAHIGTLTIDSTLKVEQRNEVIGNPSNANSYSEVNIGEEKYAKGIGLIYHKFLHLEYQPPVPGHPGAYADASYGVTMTMIDHN